VLSAEFLVLCSARQTCLDAVRQPPSREALDILSSSARRFDIPVRESIMSAMRPGVLLCVILAASCVAVKPTTPGSAGRRTEKEAAAFHQRIVSLGGVASYAETWFKEGSAVCPSPDSSLRSIEDAAWYESDTHPFLDSVLPGMRLVKMAVGGFGPRAYFVVFRDGYTRDPNRLNDILAYRWFSFDSTEMNTIAKIAVLFMYAEKPPEVVPLSRRTEAQIAPEGDSISTSPSRERAFPGVTFKSFKHEFETKAGIVRSAAVTVECEVAGIARTATVTFSRDARAVFTPDGLWTQDGVMRFRSPATP
jgi:hypothetical protein